MSSHTIHVLPNVDDLTLRVRALQDKALGAKTLRDQLVTTATNLDLEILGLKRKQDILVKVSELYRTLMDRLVLHQVKMTEDIVTEGLKAIFFDQDLKFKAEVTSKYNKISVEFLICIGDPDNGGFVGAPLESFGGGPATVASLIIRILTLLRLKRQKLLLLDETLAAISDEYIEPTAQFLSKLAGASGLNLLLIAHKAAWSDYANSSYHGDLKSEVGSKPKLHLKKVRGPTC